VNNAVYAEITELMGNRRSYNNLLLEVMYRAESQN